MIVIRMTAAVRWAENTHAIHCSVFASSSRPGSNAEKKHFSRSWL